MTMTSFKRRDETPSSVKGRYHTTPSTSGSRARSMPSIREVVDEDVEIEILHDAGKKPLFPLEPELSQTFKDYINGLITQNPDTIKALDAEPPITLRNRPRPERAANKSYCYLTTDDLKTVLKEIDAITEGWSKEDRNELKTNPEATIGLLNLHDFLAGQILQAKELCTKKARRMLKSVSAADFGVEDLIMPTEDPYEHIGKSLYWQTKAFSEYFHQEYKISFMVEKRNKSIGIAVVVKVPITPSRRKRKTKELTLESGYCHESEAVNVLNGGNNSSEKTSGKSTRGRKKSRK